MTTPLQRMHDELVRRNYAVITIRTYGRDRDGHPGDHDAINVGLSPFAAWR